MVQVADHSLHGGLGVLHREAAEGPATVIKGEVSALGGKQGQVKESLGQRAWGHPVGCARLEVIKLEDF